MANNNNTSNWASLSKDIVFLAPQSASELSYKPTVPNYVDQELLIGKPRTQKIGLELKEIRMTLKFHLFIMPFNKLKSALTLAAANGTVLTWVWGNGQIWGDFIIRSWEEKPKKTDEAGQIFVTDIEVTLKEYAGVGAKQRATQSAKQLAFAIAVTPVTPTSLVIPPVENPITKVSDGVVAINSNVSKLNKLLTKLQNAQTSLQNFKNTCQQYLNDANKYIQQVDNAVTVAENIKNGGGIQAAAGVLGASVTTMLGTVQNPALSTTVSQFEGMVNAIQGYANLLNQANAQADVVKSWFAPLRIKL